MHPFSDLFAHFAGQDSVPDALVSPEKDLMVFLINVIDDEY